LLQYYKLEKKIKVNLGDCENLYNTRTQ